MSSPKEASYRRCTTTLGKKTRFKGNLTFSSSLQIEGFFKGSIDAEGFIGIGSEADVRADITAKAASIAGRVDGDVFVKGKLELFSTASITGNVKAGQIRFQDGMELIGDCEMLQEPGSVDIFSAATDKLKANLING